MSSPPLAPSEVRPWPLAASDPIALLLGGLFVVLGAARVFSRLGMSADEVAQAQAGLLMLAASVRWWVEQRNAARVAVVADRREATAHREGLLKPQPQMRERVGAPGEGGSIEEIADDTTPVTDPPDLARVHREG
jgi:hypothetical protein